MKNNSSNYIPNFFIVGAPKAGTTSLYNYLSNHPQIYMSPLKETNYFSGDFIKQQNLYYKVEIIPNEHEYLSLFKGVSTEKIIGEASPSYLFYPNVAERIKNFNVSAKILIMLRNPVQRAYSHYLMDKRLGYVNESFEEISCKNTDDELENLYFQQYVELGKYASQVKRYLEVFNEKQVLVLLFENLVNNRQKTMDVICKFLNIDLLLLSEEVKFHNAFIKSKNKIIELIYQNGIARLIIKRLLPNRGLDWVQQTLFSNNGKPILQPKVRTILEQYYKEDIIHLEQLISKDLSAWYSKS